MLLSPYGYEFRWLAGTPEYSFGSEVKPLGSGNDVALIFEVLAGSFAMVRLLRPCLNLTIINAAALMKSQCLEARFPDLVKRPWLPRFAIRPSRSCPCFK